jgi:hypothetical protein
MGFSTEGNNASSQSILEEHLETLTEESLINQTKDAMAIYQKYDYLKILLGITFF